MDGTEKCLDSETCSKISMMQGNKIGNEDDISGIEGFYLLILYYYLNDSSKKTCKDVTKDIPYFGKLSNKEVGRGIIFKVSSIPEELQKILYRYLQLVMC